MFYKNEKMDLDELYSEFVKFYPPLSAESLGWTSLEAQQKRFKVICEAGIKEIDSVLDVGCGYGDLSLQVGEKYLGIDLRSTAIESARNKYPLRKFQTNGLFDINEKFDWVVASGIFCFSGEEEWFSYTFKNMQKMFETCNKGVAINFLSGIHYYSNNSIEKNDDDGNELIYAFPEDIMRLMRDITNNFTIRHDYGLGDFTVYMYK